jgi:hypothetical protein
MKYDLSTWPEVDLRQVHASFQEIPLAAYPALAGYDRAAIHEELAGQGGLFLACDTPEEFLLEFPACLAVHSPGWWRHHFTKTREADVLHSDLHPRGAEFWQDRVRFLLEAQRPEEMRASRRDMVYEIIRMLNRDADGFVAHFMLHAKKRKITNGHECPRISGE